MCDSSRSYFENEHDADLLDKTGEIPKEVWKRMGEEGNLGMLVPEKYDGMEMSNTEYWILGFWGSE